MKPVGFPMLALGLGLVLALLLLWGGAAGPAQAQRLPLLMMLLASELGFFVTAVGAGLGARSLLRGRASAGLLSVTLGCAALAAAFVALGLVLWPGAG